jgi:hypothetical protein
LNCLPIEYAGRRIPILRLRMDAAILAGFQGLVKDENERQSRSWAGVAHGGRIVATARREDSGSGSSMRCGSTRPSAITVRRRTNGAAVTLNLVSVFSGLPQSDPNPTRVGSQDVAGRRRVAESILRSPFSQERTRTPREKPAYPLTPTHPIAGETDWIITVQVRSQKRHYVQGIAY